MKIKTAWRAVLSPWMILVFLAVGWGPVFIAEFVRTARPDLSASYVPQAFAMGWIGITLCCSLFAAVYTVASLIKLIVIGKRLSAARTRAALSQNR